MEQYQVSAVVLDNVFFIHYICERFENVKKDEPPEVFYIVIQCGDSSIQRSFGGDGCTERELLDDFADFVRQHPGSVWVGWAMRDSQYGLDAIARRHKRLGGSPADAPMKNRFDFAQALIDIYGDDYAPHPRFLKLLELNGISRVEQERLGLIWTDAPNTKNGGFNRNNMQRRVRYLRELFILKSKGDLKTAGTGISTIEADGWYSYAELAAKFQLSPDRLRKRLDKWLKSAGDNGWQEVANRKPREPKYLFQLSAVDSIIRKLKAKISGE